MSLHLRVLVSVLPPACPDDHFCLVLRMSGVLRLSVHPILPVGLAVWVTPSGDLSSPRLQLWSPGVSVWVWVCLCLPVPAGSVCIYLMACHLDSAYLITPASHGVRGWRAFSEPGSVTCSNGPDSPPLL